jgi:hypothetical protein
MRAEDPALEVEWETVVAEAAYEFLNKSRVARMSHPEKNRTGCNTGLWILF